MIEPAERAEAAFDLAAEKHIGRGGEVVAEGEVLIDDLDALLAGLDRLGEMDRLVLDANFAAGRQEVAGDHLHEGRLAGAVVAHQAERFAVLELEVDVIQGVDRPEVLGDSLELESWQNHPPVWPRL